MSCHHAISLTIYWDCHTRYNYLLVLALQCPLIVSDGVLVVRGWRGLANITRLTLVELTLAS